MPASLPPFSAPASEARVLRAFGEEVILHLDSESTGGTLNLWTEITPPGGGPPPHYHEREDEWFLVQEGRVSFLGNGEWQEFGPGAVIFTPRGNVHAFKNVGTTPSRMLLSTTPGGFDKFFGRCEEEFARRGGPEMERVVAIAAEHGIHFIPS
ncbi:MAG: cupin domain-containing protein [Chthoniobacterales bacterium]|nr:cupin domain-containing protein [Chthoniobacterales bacterium]